MNAEDKNTERVNQNNTPEQPFVFRSSQEYINFIRQTIKENTPPKTWLSLKMLTAILDEKQVPDYFKDMGYNSLEEFLSDPEYKKLWRADKQNNSPFLVRYSYGLEIIEYIDTIQRNIASLYYNKGEKPVSVNELSKKIEECKLPINYTHIGYPSFEVFLTDKRFSTKWIAETQEDFNLILTPQLSERDIFLEKTRISLEKYFAQHTRKPSKERLVNFFSKGIANKVYKKFGFSSLEELASHSAFDAIRENSTSQIKTGDKQNESSNSSRCQTNNKNEQEEEILIQQINKCYSKLAIESEWVSLTAIASQITSIKKRVQQIGYTSLSKFIQENASKNRWQYRYTESTPPDFQLYWLDNPGPPQKITHPQEYYSEEYIIEEIRSLLKNFNNKWTLLAMLGQYIPDIKTRVEKLGYSSLGAFIKERASEGKWIYSYINNIPAKLSIKLIKEKQNNNNIKREEIEINSIPQEKNSTLSSEYLLEPGFCLKLQFKNNDILKKLVALAKPDIWRNDEPNYSILRYYITATLVRAANQFLIKADTINGKYIFHTGLFSLQDEAILGEVSTEKNLAGGLSLVFSNILIEKEQETLSKVSYYNFSENEILEYYIINPTFPLQQIDWNKVRVEVPKDDFEKNLSYSWSCLYRQIRLALPIYDIIKNEIHLALPIFQKDTTRLQGALVVMWKEKNYEPLEFITPEEFYKRARVITPLGNPFLFN